MVQQDNGLWLVCDEAGKRDRIYVVLDDTPHLRCVLRLPEGDECEVIKVVYEVGFTPRVVVRYY